MINISIDSAGALNALRKVSGDFEKKSKDALKEAGRVVQSEAQILSPISPTKAQAAGDVRYRRKAGRSPGTLQNSLSRFNPAGGTLTSVSFRATRSSTPENFTTRSGGAAGGREQGPRVPAQGRSFWTAPSSTKSGQYGRCLTV